MSESQKLPTDPPPIKASSGDIRSELESFREQWRAEVRKRNPGSSSQQQQQHNPAGPSNVSSASTALPSRPARTTEPPRRPVSRKLPASQDHDEDYVPAPSFDEHASSTSATASQTAASEAKTKKPVSALDHYELAVEREAAGQLGESLALYRKAFRMDDTVDQKYKHKHFPTLARSKPTQPNPSNAALSVSSPTQASLDGQPQTMKDLIASFARVAIEPGPPPIEGMPKPPCPMAELPDEILVHILRDVAILDVGDFVRLAQVCKRLAYLVSTENQIWRRVCVGSEFGFGGMHYYWQRGVTWEPLSADDLLAQDALTHEELAARQQAMARAETAAQFSTLYGSSWQRMFRVRPRVRFNGAYISTVNYPRSGQANVNQVTWNSPIHIVTYFRYLRLFRDGTCLTLMTTAEPSDVVHHLTREALRLHAGGAMSHLSSSVMQLALKGRWRLSNPSDNPEATVSDAEGDFFVETEGVGKYIYRLDLSVRNAGKARHNSKLIWRGSYSYNKLTDDWAEFGMKHYRPFVFSRVKSYGTGE